jgi:hypothetical protein
LRPVSGLAQGFDGVDRRVQPFAQGALQKRMFLVLLSLVRRWGTEGVDPRTSARNFSAFRLCCLVLRCSAEFFLVAAFTLSSAESCCSNPP